MAPDPPRNPELIEGNGQEGRVQDMAEFDDFYGEGEHVLAYSSQSDSPWTSEDEDLMSPGHIGQEDEVDELGNVRARTQYRMLIPFCVETIQTENDAECANDSSVCLPNNTYSSKGIIGTPTEDNRKSLSVTQPPTDRAIELDDEHVQKIKDAMKSFKLPESSIPEWAKELNEEMWRKKVLDSVRLKHLPS